MQIVEAKFKKNASQNHAASAAQSAAPHMPPIPPAEPSTRTVPTRQPPPSAPAHLDTAAMLAQLQHITANPVAGSSLPQASYSGCQPSGSGANDRSSDRSGAITLPQEDCRDKGSDVKSGALPASLQQVTGGPGITEEMRRQLHAFGSSFLDRLSDSATSAGLCGPQAAPDGLSTGKSVSSPDAQPFTGTHAFAADQYRP